MGELIDLARDNNELNITLVRSTRVRSRPVEVQGISEATHTSYDIRITRSDKLGIEVESYRSQFIRIVRISAGPVQAWNESAPTQSVVSLGDLIYEVNQKKGSTEELIS